MIVTVLVIIVMFLCFFIIAVWSRTNESGGFALRLTVWGANTTHNLQKAPLQILLYANHVNSFNHCFWKLRFLAPTVTYGNEKPEGGVQQLNITFRRSASVRGTPMKLPISFSLLNTWLPRLWARASVISISFAKVFLLTNSFSACVVQLQTYPFFLALF